MRLPDERAYNMHDQRRRPNVTPGRKLGLACIEVFLVGMIAGAGILTAWGILLLIVRLL
jgi:hypothetical protein